MAGFGGEVKLPRDEDSLPGEHGLDGGGTAECGAARLRGLEPSAELLVPRFPELHRDRGELPAEHGVAELHREGGELPAGEHGLELPAELMVHRFPDLHRDGGGSQSGGSPPGRGASKR